MGCETGGGEARLDVDNHVALHRNGSMTRQDRIARSCK
jgi:hypothetical protein